MIPIRTIAAGLAAAGVLAWGGRWAYRTMYADERDRLASRLDRALKNEAFFQDRLADAGKVRIELKAFAGSTLSPDEQEARHFLRSLLHRIAAGEGLTGIVVSDGRAEGLRNPAAGTRVKEPGLSKLLAQGSDFQVLSGTLKGTGSLEQVMRAMGVARAQPWAHRIEGFSIKPVDDTRDRFELHVEVATVLVRDLAPKEMPEPTLAALTPDSASAWREIVARNVFKAPAAPEPTRAVAAAPEQPKPRIDAPPPPPPYGDWELVGVWVSGRRVEAWVRNRSSKEGRVLTPGMAVLGAVLVSAEGERAVFEVDGQACEVSLKQTLAQRKPTK